MIQRLKWALVAGTFLSVVAVAHAETPADTLVIAKNIDDIISLDPAEAYELSGVEVDANLYDRIMRFDPTDITKLVPGAAESYTVSDDGKTITFKMRKGLKFASGNPLTAHDAAYSLQRVVKLDKNPAFLIEQLGWTKDNVDQLVTAPDDETLKVTSAVDYSPSLVLALLSSIVGSVVDQKVVASHEANGDFGNGWLKNNSAGSGAYVLKGWKPNETVSLQSNPDYRGGAPAMKRVIIRHIPEPSAQRLLLEKGDVDITRDLTNDQITGLTGNKDVTTSVVPQTTLEYVGLNVKTPQLQNPKVRQALRYLVDYNGMTNSFLKGTAQVHQSFWPSNQWASLDDNPYTFDPAKAKSLLADAGYPNGFEITLDAPSSSPYIDIAQSIQATMAQGGVKVTIIPGEQKALLTKYRARLHQMLLVYWGPDYADPHTNATGFVHNLDNSDTAKEKLLAWRNSWDIPELSKATDAAALERDTEKRKQMYLDLQRKVEDDSAFIIMFQQTKELAERANVKNFVWGPSADVVYYNLVTK
ncbi:ABC transporter substrate-binding protein [Methylovirgula sp. 4M-Z18]|uniref:ABC transporter substrate-binding protein n=1 Tax=Methylovirgula sp. 4M-Z18 TaxID=2293567 RepID=UPI001FE1988E|nr:ABC transporter substrate-binding protein [Methylovirgula sp. 4M-Z18]